MKKIIVSGHKNPDTDSICSAIAYSHLKKELGFNTQAVALGKPSLETQFVLDYFNVATPPIISSFNEISDDVILVDHNEFNQSADDIMDVNILEVIDHHRIANFTTSAPLFYRAEVLGCTSSIVCKMYQEKKIEIPYHIAGLMLSAIISDTLLFKSPTCTPEDIEIAHYLATLIDIDVETYGLELLKAGASIKGKSALDLISIDCKPFTMNQYNVLIAQISVIDIQEVINMKEDLLKAMEQVALQEEANIFFTIITDVLNNNSKGIILG
ncbi:MAG: manganese-dependent inorganic pyrophosphatase, partial [Bacilli bacterium]